MGIDRVGIREHELELEKEIKEFENERENVRQIIGKIGGVPTTRTRWINIMVAALVLLAFGLSVVWGGRLRFIMIEVGILLLSVKLIFLLESHTKLSHFNFWILSSLEWRLDKIDKRLKELSEK